MKKIGFITICVCFFMFCLLHYPDAMIAASTEGLTLWLTKVFPSLFAFMVTCSLLIQIGAAQKFGKLLAPLMRPVFHLPGSAAFPYFLGLLSGYPMGAKMTTSLYKGGLLSLDDAKHVLTFSNNPGPLFLVATIGTMFLGNPQWGYAFLLCAFLGATTTGILYGRIKKNTPKTNKSFRASASLHTNPQTTAPMPFMDALSYSIQNSMATLMQVGGYIILFCVIARACTETGVFALLRQLFSFLPVSDAFLDGFFSGILEMTNGAFLVANAPDPAPLRLVAISFLTSFGGLSILGQTLSIIEELPIKKSFYIKAKLCNGVFSSAFFLLLYPWLEKTTQKAVPAFYSLAETAFNYSFSIWYILFLAAVVLLLYRKAN